MWRQVDVAVATEFADDVAGVLEKIKQLQSLVCLQGICTLTFRFVIHAERLNKILYKLAKIGCGISYGQISVCQLSMMMPLPSQKTNTLPYAAGMRSRLPIEELYDRVLGMASTGFNHLVFLIVAASVASLGLIFNSATTVISAMLLSPLMDPLVACIFGVGIWDKKMFLTDIKSFCFGTVIVFVTGFLFGLCFGNWAKALNWPTNEMVARGTYTSVIAGAFVAVPSGLAVALCITNGGVNPLVGAAIAASILPPVANTGILWAMAALVSVVQNTHTPVSFSYNTSLNTYVMDNYSSCDYMALGGFSFGVFGVNIFLISIAAYLMFRVKSIIEFKGRDPLYADLPKILELPQEERPWNQDPDLQHVKRSPKPKHHFKVHPIKRARSLSLGNDRPTSTKTPLSSYSSEEEELDYTCVMGNLPAFHKTREHMRALSSGI